MSSAWDKTVLPARVLACALGLGLLLALSESAASEPKEEGCDSLGRGYERLLEELGPVCEECREEDVLRRTARLFVEPRHGPALCPVEGELGENCSPIETSLLGPPLVGAVVRQWNGDLVEVDALPGESGLVAVRIRLLDRSPAAAFCPGYKGPLEPAPAEEYYDTAWQAGRSDAYGLGWDSSSGRQLADGTGVRLHPYKATVGFFPPGWQDVAVPKETVGFEVPAPYAGRDILDLVALSRDHFFFRLSDGRLYSWKQGDLRELEESRGQVLEIELGGDGNLYFWAAHWIADEKARKWQDNVRWNAIGRVTPDLELTTVWESTTHAVISRLIWEDGLDLDLGRIRNKQEVMICSDGREVDPADGAAGCSSEGRKPPGPGLEEVPSSNGLRLR